MTQEISNTDDVIDSRDVIERIEELEDLEPDPDHCEECGEDRAFHADPAVSHGFFAPVFEEADELEALQALAKEASGYVPDWKYGEALIRRTYFTEYAQQLAEDCGMVNDQAQWPNNCIDWEQASRELELDYTSVEFDGVEYLIR